MQALVSWEITLSVYKIKLLFTEQVFYVIVYNPSNLKWYWSV